MLFLRLKCTVLKFWPRLSPRPTGDLAAPLPRHPMGRGMANGRKAIVWAGNWLVGEQEGEKRGRKTGNGGSSPMPFRLRNDLYCVEWGVKLYSLTHYSEGFDAPILQAWHQRHVRIHLRLCKSKRCRLQQLDKTPLPRLHTSVVVHDAIVLKYSMSSVSSRAGGIWTAKRRTTRYDWFPRSRSNGVW